MRPPPPGEFHVMELCPQPTRGKAFSTTRLCIVGHESTIPSWVRWAASLWRNNAVRTLQTVGKQGEEKMGRWKPGTVPSPISGH